MLVWRQVSRGMGYGRRDIGPISEGYGQIGGEEGIGEGGGGAGAGQLEVGADG